MIQHVLQGFGTVYIEGHRRVLEITADILNNVSNNCKYGRYCFVVVFALTDAGKLRTWLKLFRGFDQVTATKGLASFNCCLHFQRM
jgi:hypothetical protein